MTDYIAPSAQDMDDRLARLFNPKVDALNNREALELIYKLASMHGFSITLTTPQYVLDVAYEHDKQISLAYAAQLLRSINTTITEACELEAQHVIEEMVFSFVSDDAWPDDTEITNV